MPMTMVTALPTIRSDAFTWLLNRGITASRATTISPVTTHRHLAITRRHHYRGTISQDGHPATPGVHPGRAALTAIGHVPVSGASIEADRHGGITGTIAAGGIVVAGIAVAIIVEATAGAGTDSASPHRAYTSERSASG